MAHEINGTRLFRDQNYGTENRNHHWGGAWRPYRRSRTAHACEYQTHRLRTDGYGGRNRPNGELQREPDRYRRAPLFFEVRPSHAVVARYAANPGSCLEGRKSSQPPLSRPTEDIQGLRQWTRSRVCRPGDAGPSAAVAHLFSPQIF